MIRVRTSYRAVAVIALAVVVGVAPVPASWIEQIYSREVYLVGQQVLTSLSGFFSVAVLDVMAVLGLVGFIYWWVRALRVNVQESRMRIIAKMCLNTVATVAVLYLIFMVLWGFNYRRQPLVAKLDYDATRISSTGLLDFSKNTVERLNRLHGRASSTEWPTFAELPDRFGQAFSVVQRRLGGSRTAVAGRPKNTLLSPYFKRAGIDGMVSPFSLEVLVNHTVLPYERPFLVAHEWAHLAGYANEAEASFVGVLTCLAGDAQSQYSAWLFLMPQLVRHLSQEDRVDVYARLHDGPRQHLREISDRLNESVPFVRRNASRAYDRFLRANRVTSGIASYGLVVNLLMGTSGTDVWKGLIRQDDMISRALGENDV